MSSIVWTYVCVCVCVCGIDQEAFTQQSQTWPGFLGNRPVQNKKNELVKNNMHEEQYDASMIQSFDISLAVDQLF